MCKAVIHTVNIIRYVMHMYRKLPDQSPNIKIPKCYKPVVTGHLSDIFKENIK